MKYLLASVLLALAMTAQAQMSPVGRWLNVDDKTGETKAQIRIEENDNGLRGWIEKTLAKDAKPDAVCSECSDDRKGKPMVGLEIIRGGRKGSERWEGGRILDPENGKEYRASFLPIDGGKKLEVRGYLGPFWRTQVWNRSAQ